MTLLADQCLEQSSESGFFKLLCFPCPRVLASALSPSETLLCYWNLYGNNEHHDKQEGHPEGLQLLCWWAWLEVGASHVWASDMWGGHSCSLQSSAWCSVFRGSWFSLAVPSSFALCSPCSGFAKGASWWCHLPLPWQCLWWHGEPDGHLSPPCKNGFLPSSQICPSPSG